MIRRKVTTTAERLHSPHGGFLGGATAADAEEIVLHGGSYHGTGHLPPPLPLPVCSEHPRKKTEIFRGGSRNRQETDGTRKTGQAWRAGESAERERNSEHARSAMTGRTPRFLHACVPRAILGAKVT